MSLKLNYKTNQHLISFNLLDSASIWFQYSDTYVNEFFKKNIIDVDQNTFKMIINKYKPIRTQIGWKDELYKSVYENSLDLKFSEISKLVKKFNEIRLQNDGLILNIDEYTRKLLYIGNNFVSFASGTNHLYTEILRPYYKLSPKSDFSKEINCYVGVSPTERYTASALKKSMILEVSNDQTTFEHYLIIVIHEFIHTSFNTHSLIELDESNRPFWETVRADIDRRNITLVDEGFAYYLTEVVIEGKDYRKISERYKNIKGRNDIQSKNMFFTGECIRVIGENLDGIKITKDNKDSIVKNILSDSYKVLLKN